MSATRWRRSTPRRPSAPWRCCARPRRWRRRHEICRRISRRQARAKASRRRSPPKSIRREAIVSWSFAAAIRMRSRAMASKTCCPRMCAMIHGPGCPVCVLPVGRIDDAITLASRPARDAVHLRRSDARAGSRGTSLLKAQARRAPTSAWSIRRSTLCASPRRSPSARWCSLAIGFETTTPPTALAIKQAKAKAAAQFLRLLQSCADAAGDPRDFGGRER